MFLIEDDSKIPSILKFCGLCRRRLTKFLPHDCQKRWNVLFQEAGWREGRGENFRFFDSAVSGFSGIRVRVRQHKSCKQVVPACIQDKDQGKRATARNAVTLCFLWCLGRESNPYSTKYRGILSPLRLPVPPPRQVVSPQLIEKATKTPNRNNRFSSESDEALLSGTEENVKICPIASEGKTHASRHGTGRPCSAESGRLKRWPFP